MTKLRLKHVHAYADRHGKWRCYVRPPGGGKRIPLPGRVGSAEFMEAYQAALAGIELPTKQPIGADRTLAGTIDSALVGFYGHKTFTELAEGSRVTRRTYLEMFRRDHGTKPIAALRHAHIEKILAGHKPSTAKGMFYALKPLMQFAVATGLIQLDPMAAMKAPKVKYGSIHTWTEDEIALYRARHPIGTTARIALELALNTAARRADLIKLGPQHIRDGKLYYTQQKTKAEVALPVHPDLFEVLKVQPIQHIMLFLAATTGRAFNVNTFNNKFREWCDEAGLTHCSVHGLRKAQATRLADAGCSPHEIMAVTGHKTLSEVQRYTEAADRNRNAEKAMTRAYGKPVPGTSIG